MARPTASLFYLGVPDEQRAHCFGAGDGSQGNGGQGEEQDRDAGGDHCGYRGSGVVRTLL